MSNASLNSILEIGKLDTLSEISYRGKNYEGTFSVFAIPVLGSKRNEVELYALLESIGHKSLMPLCPYDDVIRKSSYDRNGYIVIVDEAMGIDDRRSEGSSWFGPEDPANDPFQRYLSKAKNPVARALATNKTSSVPRIDITDDKEEELFNAYQYCEQNRLGRSDSDKNYIFFAEESEQEMSQSDVASRAIATGLLLYTNFSPSSISSVSAHSMLIRARDMVDEGRVQLDKQTIEREIKDNDRSLKRLRDWSKEQLEYKQKQKKSWMALRP